ncbi:MAG: CoA-binding protein [Deltaproteobacteria bacterium]|nr:CoA-binding protein [Deltaproteobacteria bacterium]
MIHERYSDDYIRTILNGVKTIAMVGCSSKWNRPSNFAMKYLQGKGYRVIPVNPGAAGSEILGEKVYATLEEIPAPFEMVDIFLAPKRVDGVVDMAISLAKEKSISVIWMQLGIRNDAAASRAEEARLRVVMNRCPKIEYGRLYGELGWGGINSGIISSKRLKKGQL